jgi:hypothetical protein
MFVGSDRIYAACNPLASDFKIANYFRKQLTSDVVAGEARRSGATSFGAVATESRSLALRGCTRQAFIPPDGGGTMKIVLSVILTMVLAIGSGTTIAQTVTERVLTEADWPKPADLGRFNHVVESFYYDKFEKAHGNEIRLGAMIADRGVALRQALGGSTTFKNWHLEVNHLGLDSDGWAWIVFVVPAGLRDIRTHFSLVSRPATGADTMKLRLAPGSPLFTVAKALDVGDRADVSGELLADSTSGYLEIVNASHDDLESRMQSPRFAAKFTDIVPTKD